jgi:hypothetical protein
MMQQNTMRTIPVNRKGQQDEWSALINLQNASADKRDRARKMEEDTKKKAYLQELMGNIEVKQK